MSEYIVELDGKRSIALGLAFVEEIRGGDFVHGEIVRCRDCKHYMDYEHEYEPNLGYCREHDREEVRDSGFCAWGERRQA